MALEQETRRGLDPPGKPAAPDKTAPSLIDMMMRDLHDDLDDIAEPTAAELEAMDDLEGLEELADPLELLPPPPAIHPPALEEPELVSLESLDDAAEAEPLEDEALEDDEFLDELLDDYVDIDLEDEDLDDEGYDLEDEDIVSYQDLYGEDDSIIPSFREGELDDDDEGDVAYYDGLR